MDQSSLSGFSGIAKIPELKRRLLFTLMMLAVYRIGVHVPTPGIDGAVLGEILNQFKGTLFGVFNMFSGGAFQRMSIFALGIMPYISASIVVPGSCSLFTAIYAMNDNGNKKLKKKRKSTSSEVYEPNSVSADSLANNLNSYKHKLRRD